MKNLIKNISGATLSELSTVFKKAVEEAYQAGRENVQQEAQLDEILVGKTVKYLGGSKKYGFLTAGENYRVLKRSTHPHENIPVLQIEDDREGDGCSLIRPDTVHLFEVVEDAPVIELQDSPPKTNNQKRAELIQWAKACVVNKLNINGYVAVSKGGNLFDCIPEFIVNTKNRMVTVLLRGYETKKIYAKGIAKCAPGEVFNEWIGKAIALARALEIIVPYEFLNAVQPDDLVKGQHIDLYNENGELHITGELLNVFNQNVVSFFTKDYEEYRGFPYNRTTLDGIKKLSAKIINDTNAIYGTGA